MYNNDEEKRKILTEEYHDISNRLQKIWNDGIIDEDTLCCIIIGMKRVLEKIAVKYSKVIEEGEKAMGGEILDYPAKTAKREGIKQGLLQGRREGRREGRQEGQNELVKAVELLREGKTVDELKAQGINEQTVELAIAIK